MDSAPMCRASRPPTHHRQVLDRHPVYSEYIHPILSASTAWYYIIKQQVSSIATAYTNFTVLISSSLPELQFHSSVQYYRRPNKLLTKASCEFLIKMTPPAVDPSLLRWRSNTSKRCSRCEFWRGLCILLGKVNNYGFVFENIHLESLFHDITLISFVFEPFDLF